MPDVTTVPQWVQMHRFLKFLAVGAIGFACDAGLLLLLIDQYDWNPYYARIPSFLFAVSVTWLLNRLITFSDSKRDTKRDEYASYVVVQVGGALINFGVYFMMIAYAASPFNHPLIALLGGAVPGLVFNYLGAKLVVYNQSKETAKQ